MSIAHVPLSFGKPEMVISSVLCAKQTHLPRLWLEFKMNTRQTGSWKWKLMFSSLTTSFKRLYPHKVHNSGHFHVAQCIVQRKKS